MNYEKKVDTNEAIRVYNLFLLVVKNDVIKIYILVFL